MGKRLGVLTLVFSLICSLSFAQDNTAATAKTDAKAKPAAVKAAPAQMQMPKMPKIDPKVWDFLPAIVATVGDKKISKAKLVKTLEPQVKMLLAMGQKLTPQQYQMLAKNMTDELIKATILEKLAADAGYKVTPKIEEEVYKKFAERFQKQLPKGQKLNFADIIKKQGLDINDVKKQLAEGEVVQNWIKDKIAKDVKVSDDAATKFYNDNKDRFFKRPETVSASHILIKPKTETPAGWNDAKAEAEKVYKKVQAGGNFAELAKQYSQGPSAQNGGSLGKFTKGQMVPEFEAACWKLAKANKINGTDLVKTKFGWHIIEVTAYDPGGYVKLDSKLLGQIKEQLQQQQVAQKVKELIEQATKKLNPVVNFKVEKAAAPVVPTPAAAK